ncbi:hypothetical protein L5515_018679 [Caenorhabditis briggsae]|uniref:Ubiquitin-like domain-containing protein n=1 Tax=Caenorhabditis briggsae TaxID=6238 RepID=A0AAE9FC28_CAEBR|nr:hypothetical protein L5515_018679 [Caenorhabditis briggsae]
MVRVTIRLIGEHEDVIFISEYIHIGDLVKRIESLTRIPPVFQQYRFRNEDHPFVAHPIQDIKLGEEIVVVS